MCATSMEAPAGDNAPAVRFSVIIPAYNAETALPATVASVLAQTLPDFEIVIADDGSKDATVAVAEKLAGSDPRVRALSQPNAGCAAARNLAAGSARGEYLVLLDADDELEPDYLVRQAAFIEANPGYDIYSCNATRVFQSGRTEPFFSGAPFDRVFSATLTDEIAMNRVFVQAAFRRDLWERLGGFRTDLRYAEDYDFWLRSLAARARHIYQPAMLGRYHELPGGKSRNRVPHAQAQIRMFIELAKTEGLSAEERAACEDKIARLERRIARVELERRVREGDSTGARREYVRVRDAYLSARLYWAGFGLMMLSPRLYARAMAKRAEQ